MAKQRPQSKPKAPAPAPPPEQDQVPTSQSSTQQQTPPTTSTAQGAARRSSYFEAVALYEKGLEALQRHEYDQAVDLLRGVLSRYPDEKELHERVRLYLNICERHATPRTAAPQSVEERLYASTLAINGGKYDEAISHLRLVRDEDPDNDHALYMLAVAHAQRGEHTEAVAHLERSIALNPENRAMARRDPDLEPLHDDEAFLSAIKARISHDGDRRALRPRTAR